MTSHECGTQRLARRPLTRRFYFYSVLASLIACSAVLPRTTVYADDCKNLSQDQCWRSTACTLDCSETARETKCAPYICRSKRGPCEKGLAQEKMSAEACEGRSVCTYVKAFCYCPTDLTCFCSGGPPARCIEKNHASQK